MCGRRRKKRVRGERVVKGVSLIETSDAAVVDDCPDDLK